MPQPPHPKRARVLVVDDDELCRRHLMRLLEYQGHEALPASDAQTALGILREGKADVIITDLCMPDMQGPDLIRRAKKIDAHVPC
ncbi:MAG: response regulator, partial [Myxococcota bacterium]|nr:response regulator [Myxococcota bacterium]